MFNTQKGVTTAGPAAHRRQLKQDATAITIVGDLISGDTAGAGTAIAEASANNDAAGIASALTNAASLVTCSTPKRCPFVFSLA